MRLLWHLLASALCSTDSPRELLPLFFYRLVFASVLQAASCIKLSDTENDVWSTQRSPLYKICRSDEGCAGWAAMGLPFRLLGKVN